MPSASASAVHPVTIDPNINYTLQSFGTDFTYDSYAPVSELKTVAADQTPFSTSTYTFDNARNRTQLVQGPSGSQTTSTYTYDRADRILTSGTNGNITDTMDADGNLKSRTGGSVNDRFSYDQANRLTSATTSAGSGTYTYDGDGKRTSKTVSSVTTNYVYDVAGGLPRLLTDGTHKFVRGANGLAYSIAVTGGAVATYHADQIGSIREITNSDGSVRTTYLTDEYGNRTTVKGTDDQPFQFTGEQVDSETGFVYLRSRYYDSPTGRFTSRDYWNGIFGEPGSLNRHVYTGNNPINYADPSGRACIGLGLGGSGEAGNTAGGAPFVAITGSGNLNLCFSGAGPQVSTSTSFGFVANLPSVGGITPAIMIAAPDQQTATVEGAYIGGSIIGYVSPSANNVNDLAGPFLTTTVDTPLGSIGYQEGTNSNGVPVSVGVGSIGPGLIAGATQYQTSTTPLIQLPEMPPTATDPPQGGP